jgi:hypothetical protein
MSRPGTSSTTRLSNSTLVPAGALITQCERFSSSFSTDLMLSMNLERFVKSRQKSYSSRAGLLITTDSVTSALSCLLRLRPELLPPEDPRPSMNGRAAPITAPARAAPTMVARSGLLLSW